MFKDRTGRQRILFFSEIDQDIVQFQIIEYDETANLVKVVAVGGESANFRGKGECNISNFFDLSPTSGYTVLAAYYDPEDDTLRVTAGWHQAKYSADVANHFFLVGEGFKHAKI